MNDTIPEFLPRISSGKHRSPEQGACVMEYISMLAGEEFTDFPKCTHRSLAQLAQNANDHMPDRERYRLVPLINRLFGTGTDDHKVHVEMITWLLRRAEADLKAAKEAFAVLWPAFSEGDMKKALAALDDSVDLTIKQMGYHLTPKPNYFAWPKGNWGVLTVRASRLAGSALYDRHFISGAQDYWKQVLALLTEAIDHYDAVTGRGADVEDVACRLPEVAARVGR